MHHQYYIDNAGDKDGPHDLVTIMRRIRAQKVGPDTHIYVDNATVSLPATQIEDIALFFSRQAPADSSANIAKPVFSLLGVIHDGWHFTLENNVITVFSGGMTLTAILLATQLIDALGVLAGGMLAWLVFMMFQYIFLICTLRFYRRQPFSSDFINHQLAPILHTLLFAAIVIGLMIAGGFFLLIIPSIVVAVYYVFVPFLILDRQLSVLEAMYASRLLVQKHNKRYQKTFELLVIVYASCLILIIPLPLAMPMFAAGLVKLYEELSTS